MNYCQEFSCQRPHRNKVHLNKAWYCSELCAQQAVRNQGVGIKSEATASSFNQGVGEPSAESLRDVAPNLEEQQETSNAGRENRETATAVTRNDTEQKQENPGTEEWPSTQKKSASVTVSTGKELTRRESSGLQLQSFEGERSDSMSLIDDSILHLHGLMKSVEQNVKERAKIGERIGHVDPQAINSAVNCAKQMGELLKLKILYHKELK